MVFRAVDSGRGRNNVIGMVSTIEGVKADTERMSLTGGQSLTPLPLILKLRATSSPL